MELAKHLLPFFVSDSVVFARYSDFRYLVVCGCDSGLVNGTASAARAPCGQSPEPPFVLRGQKNETSARDWRALALPPDSGE